MGEKRNFDSHSNKKVVPPEATYFFFPSSRRCFTTSCISSSFRIYFHGGIPLSVPSLMISANFLSSFFCVISSARFVGLLGKPAAMGPSPSPRVPWQVAQFFSKIAFPSVLAEGAGGGGGITG